LEHHLQLWQEDNRPGLVLLMEGADPIEEVRDLRDWWRRGRRMIRLTFGNTKYGAGVGGGSLAFSRDGLTSARALTPTDRHLSDCIIREIPARNGLIGIALYNGFLEPGWIADRTIQVTLSEQVRKQTQYIADRTT
jgi:membrane dipeptidase